MSSPICHITTKAAGILALFSSLAAAQYSGVATFNNYEAPGTTTVCGPTSGQYGYGVALGDLSPNLWSGPTCNGSYTNPDYSQCAAVSDGTYVGPSCPQTTCGECFTVTNNGGYGGASVQGVGNQITVQVIDVCPAESADNYCKTSVPANERCGDPSTKSMDIDQSAYQALTGTPYASGVPNLMIGITGPVACPGSSRLKRNPRI